MKKCKALNNVHTLVFNVLIRPCLSHKTWVQNLRSQYLTLKTSSEGWKKKLLLSSVLSLKNSLCKEQVARCGWVKNNYVPTSQERVSSFVQKGLKESGKTKTKMILFDLLITGLPVKPSCLNAGIMDPSRNWYNRGRSSSVTVHSDLEGVHPKCQLW